MSAPIVLCRSYKTSLSLSFHTCTTGIAVPTSGLLSQQESNYSGLSVRCFAVTVLTTLHPATEAPSPAPAQTAPSPAPLTQGSPQTPLGPRLRWGRHLPLLLRSQEGPNLLPDSRNTPLGSTARQVTASRWATMECTHFPEGGGAAAYSPTLRLSQGGEG